VNDIHGAHRATGIVENPFLSIGVDTDLRGGISCCEVRDDVVDHSSGVVRVGRNSCLRYFMQSFGLEDIPPILEEN
jgi:hypothetical protein